MRFENKQNLINENKAISLFCSKYSMEFVKLGENDIDFLVSKDNKEYYLEVKGRRRNISNAYPLPMAARKMVKLCDKRKPSIIIWDCNDGIIYGGVNELKCTGRVGGRTPRESSHNDIEFMLYFDKQEALHTINKQ